MEREVFELVGEIDLSFNIKIFNFKFINEIKNKNINKIFKKLKLVI